MEFHSWVVFGLCYTYEHFLYKKPRTTFEYTNKQHILASYIITVIVERFRKYQKLNNRFVCRDRDSSAATLNATQAKFNQHVVTLYTSYSQFNPRFLKTLLNPITGQFVVQLEKKNFRVYCFFFFFLK